MKNKYVRIQFFAVVACLVFGLQACSLPTKILPDAEFNALMVDADAAIHDGRWELASSKLDQAANLQPNNLNVKLKQGLAYQLSGKLALAHNAYQQVIDAAPNPAGKNIEIVRAAKTNQAKLGFKPLEAVTEPPSSSTSKQDMEAVVAEPAAIALVPDSVETKELIAEVASVNQVASANEASKAVINVEDEAKQRVEAWLAAWQDKRVDDYLAFYQSGFKGDFASHSEWKKQRASRINAAKNISIRMTDIKVEQQDATTIVVSFTQTYQSENHTDTGLKTLHLKKINDHWLITLEQFTKQ